MLACLVRLPVHPVRVGVAPPLRLCTDNAVMVAWAALERLRQGWTDGLNHAPRPRWPLDSADMKPEAA